MSVIASSFSRDANGIPIVNRGLTETKSITYLTATTGATGATTLFTVTGTVIVNIFGVCTVDLTGASATLEVGIAGNTAALIALTVGTTIDAGEIWTATSPPTVVAVGTDKIISGTNIIQTIATAAVDTGAITYYCNWTPISSNGNVVAA
jgi:hypothetical protein